MNKVLLKALIAVLAVFFVFVAPAQASDSKPVELKLWGAWIPDTFSSDPFLHMFMDMVNEKGKAANLSIKFVGGPEVFKAFDGILVDSEVVIVSVLNTNRAPVLNPVGPQAVTEGDTLTLVVSATDPDATIPTLSTSTLPPNATFIDNLDGSGTFEFMPDFMRPVVDAIPVTYLGDALRQIMVDAAPLHSLSTNVAVLAAWFVGCLLLSARLFRWE